MWRTRPKRGFRRNGTKRIGLVKGARRRWGSNERRGAGQAVANARGANGQNKGLRKKGCRLRRPQDEIGVAVRERRSAVVHAAAV